MKTVALAATAMATRFELVLHGESEAQLRAAGEEAIAEIHRLENQLSLYRPGSEIAQINARAAAVPVQVSPEIFALLAHATELTRATGGAFDITIGPLVRAWGFMTACPRLPTPEEIAAARQLVGADKIILDAQNRTIRFAQAGMILDLGAIGKGYAIDRAAEILREAGVRSALLHGGTSTVSAIGQPPDSAYWEVALPEKTVTQGAPTPPSFRLCDEALSVSAISGRSFEAGGRTFGHVIDPRTGQPVAHTRLTAVALPSATETDALSTALLVGGHTDHERISRLRAGMRSLLVAADGAVKSLPP
jgi:thiamine biosynthesis lipoprotein